MHFFYCYVLDYLANIISHRWNQWLQDPRENILLKMLFAIYWVHQDNNILQFFFKNQTDKIAYQYTSTC